MELEVASIQIKPDPGPFRPPNFPLQDLPNCDLVHYTYTI